MPSHGSRFAFLASTLAALPLALTITRDAQAVPYTPRFAGVINVPLTIPANGVLGVGLIDNNFTAGIPSTQGELSQVLLDTIDVPGAMSEFTVPVGAGTQIISVWAPDTPFALGSYQALSTDEFDEPAASNFEAVAATELELPTIEVDAIELSETLVPVSQIPCGVTVSLNGGDYPVSVTTHYGLQPTLTVRFATDASDAVLSQHYFRVSAGGQAEARFAPALFSDGLNSRQFQYVPAESYCQTLELVSLVTHEVVALDPVCADDDGRDWDAIVPATAGQFDADLRQCQDVPEDFLPRYCALRVAQGLLPVGCEEFTQEELDAALQAPLPIDPAPPVMPEAEPSVEPTVEPGVAPPMVVPPDGNPEPTSIPEPSASDPNVPADVELDPTEPEAAPDDRDTTEPVASDDDLNDDDGVDAKRDTDDTIAMASKSGSDGGCALAAGGSAAGFYWLGLLALGASFVRRRRRPR